MSYNFSRLFNMNRNIMISISSHIILISLFFFFLEPTISVAEIETDQLFDIYSRDEMAKIAGYGEEKLSTVLVTGSVHCQTCLRHSQTHSWPVSGASVAINCRSNKKKAVKPINKLIKGVTDENGDFIIDLPSDLHAIANLDKKCFVRVLRLPKKSLCKPANSVTKHKALRLSSVGNGIRTYTSGTLRFHHLAATPGCGRQGRIKSF